MDRPQRAAGNGGGSVRRARERMEAGMPPEMPPPQLPAQSPPRQRPFDGTRAVQTSPSSKSKIPVVQAVPSSKNPGIGVAISRPTLVPQWPLAAPIETSSDQKNSANQYQPPSGRAQAPQRPPRPRDVPSMLDASRLQEHTPAFQYKPQQGAQRRQRDDDPLSPDLLSPMTPASRASTTSSVGTIPDFPLPIPGIPTSAPRRSANLGPPPSSRRGASSYYSNISYVSPIPEESPRAQGSHGSYASSSAMPTNAWDDGSQYDDYEDDIIEEVDGRESSYDDAEERGLVRSASIGRRGKPSMVTTKSAEKVEPLPKAAESKANVARDNLARLAAGAVVSGSTTRPGASTTQKEPAGTVWPKFGNDDSSLEGVGTMLISESSSSSGSVPTLAKNVTAKDALGVPNDDATPERSHSRLSAIRRPPKLDIDAVRAQEARGSLTSLPDLIRRATRLAAMIDRGKRPASRLNDLNDFPSEREKGSYESGDEEKRQSGLSGMLAAFPPPGLVTSPSHDNPGSAWPSPAIYQDGLTPQNGEKAPPSKKRRCCGMPLWVFLVISFIALLIIAAAVVVPLELIVFRKTSNTTTAASALAVCQSNTTCENGGTIIAVSGGCSCICANGFSGTTCSIAGSSQCVTTSISSINATNATLGDAIPRLVTQAQSNFSIPLSYNLILARFNSANLTCDTENALVTFDGMKARIGSGSAAVILSTMTTTTPTSSPATSSSATSTATNAFNARQEANGISVSVSVSVSVRSPTTVGPTSSVNPTIVVDTSAFTAPTRASSTSAALTNANPASTGGSKTSTASVPSSTFVITQVTLDFARVSVLYILQQQELNNAITAQTTLQRFFNNGPGSTALLLAGNFTLGNGNSIDLVGLRIDLGAGLMGSGNSMGSGGAKFRRRRLSI